MKTGKLSAAIDLGTNSFILMVINKKDEIVLEKFETIALGDKKEELNIKIERAKKALRRFLNELEKISIEKLYIFGTQFFRKNPEFFEAILQDIQVNNLEAKILSEKEEALFSYFSVELDTKININNPVVVDIGGGSVEIIFKESKTIRYKSLEIGAWQLTNRFVKQFPIGNETMKKMRGFISKQLANNQVKDRTLIGLGGTFVTLAAMYKSRWFDSLEQLHNTKIPKDWIMKMREKLFEFTLDEIKKIPGLPEDRARIMPAGILLVSELLDRLSEKNHLVVSSKGCRYSIARYGFSLDAISSPRR